MSNVYSVSNEEDNFVKTLKDDLLRSDDKGSHRSSSSISSIQLQQIFASYGKVRPAMW